jgi:DNA-directed RNA polymerase subunit H (RpoH/RPB5)
MMQLTHPPQAVVRHLAGAFCRHRGFELAPREGGPGRARESAAAAGPAPSPEPSGDQIVHDLERIGYVRLDARRLAPRGRRDRVVILVLAAGGAQALHSPDLRRLLGSVQAELQAREGRLDEIVLVAEDPFFARKNLTDLVAATRRDAEAERRRLRAPPGDPEGAAIFFGAYRYSTFAHVVPDHVAVPPHRLMSADETKALLEAERCELASLPVILAEDPPVVWLGGRGGQVVEIWRDSLSVLKAPYYRRVVETA